MIGTFLSKDYEKNPSKNVLQDVKSYADLLNQEKGLSAEDQKKVMENLLGIGDMKMDNLRLESLVFSINDQDFKTFVSLTSCQTLRTASMDRWTV